jgi:hypothetical protein
MRGGREGDKPMFSVVVDVWRRPRNVGDGSLARRGVLPTEVEVITGEVM